MEDAPVTTTGAPRGRSARVVRTVRHPGDVVRVVAGTALFAAGAAVARHGWLSNVETDVSRLVNDFPAGLDGILRVAMQAGSLLAVPVVALAAFAARRPRLARDSLLAGFASWVFATGAEVVLGGAGVPLDVGMFPGGVDTGVGFPSTYAAVAAALVTAAGPHVGRTARRVAWCGVAVVGVSRIFVDTELPVDVVGGVALGWALGAVVHVLFGAPAGDVDEHAVHVALAEVKTGPFDVTRARVDARGSTPFFVTGPAGDRWFVKAVGRRQRDADLLFKSWRALTRRGLEDEPPFVTAKQQVEHEAYLSLLALRAGVRTPAVVAAATTSDGTALLVLDRVDGRSLDAVDADAVTDAVLAELWAEVSRLRATRIAHRDLRLANVLLDRHGQPWLIDFGFAEAAASPRRLAQDVAELLASSASLVGPQRAVAGACAALGTEAVAAAVPLLQPLALSNATRSMLRGRDGLLDAVRAAAAGAAGVATTELEPLARVRPRNVVLLVGGLLGIHFLLPQVGELGRTLASINAAEPEWLAAAVACSVATYLAAGLAQLGAVPERLSYASTTWVQVASSFTGPFTPGFLGGVGVNVRYLQRAGLDRNGAYAAVALNSVAGGIVHLLAIAVTAAVIGGSVDLVKLPNRGEVLLALVAALLLLGILRWTPLGRHRLVLPIRHAVRSVAGVLRRPAKAAQLFGGSVAITAFNVLALAASLEAFQSPLPIIEVAAIYLGGAAIASAAPTPGGLGAFEAALVAGLTAFGTPAGPAIAGVLAFRLVTFWLPVLPGWLVYRSLAHRNLI